MGAISDLTDKQIESVVARYRTAGLTEGGKYSLSDLLLEQRRRKPTIFPPRDVAQTIIEKSRSSPDGLVSYGEIWNAFLPDRPWEANNSRRIVADALFRVIGYCVENGLPILTVLVVRKSERRLSSEAVEHIYRESRELGVEVGGDPLAFVTREREKALQLSLRDLPALDSD